MSIFKINKSPDEERSDQELRNKLDAHSVTPPSYIWDNVEENLPQKQNRRPLIFWLLPLAACLAGLLGLLYVVLPKNALMNSQNQTATQYKASPETENKSGYSKAKNAEILAGKNTEKDQSIKEKNIADKANNFNKNLSSRPDKKSPSKTANKFSTSKNYVADNNARDINSNVEKNIPGKLIGPEKVNENQIALNNPEEAVDSIAETKEDQTQIALGPGNKYPEKGNKSSNKWAFGAEMGAGYSYRLLNNSSGPSFGFVTQDVNNTQNNTEKPRNFNDVESAGFSWSGALNVKYEINDNWSIISGLGYTRANIRSKINLSAKPAQNGPLTNQNPDTNYVQENSTGAISFSNEQLPIRSLSLEDRKISNENILNYSFSYLDIPLAVQYKTSAHKTAFYAQGGATARFLRRKNAHYKTGIAEKHMRLTESYNRLGISTNISAGVSFPVKNFDLQVGPAFSFWLTPLMRSEPKTHLYNTHLKAAVFYNFGN